MRFCPLSRIVTVWCAFSLRDRRRAFAPTHPPHRSLLRQVTCLMGGFLIWLAASPAFAALPQAVHWEAAHHAVKVTAGSSVGSGGYLGDRLVLTCEHVVRGEDPERVWVSFPEPQGQPGQFADDVQGRVIALDATWDQCLVELERAPQHNPPGAVIADDNVQPGETLHAVGYPGGGTLQASRGQLVTYGGALHAEESDWAEVSARGVQGGYSGGPVFDEAGRMVGNVWGSDGMSAQVISVARTRIFLIPVWTRIQTWHATARPQPTQWGGYCPPGYSCPTPPRYVQPQQPGRSVRQGGQPSPVPRQTQPAPKPAPACPCDSEAVGEKIRELLAEVQAIRQENRERPAAEPTKPEPPTAPAEPAEVDYGRIIEGVVAELAKRPEFRGPPGPQGPRGSDGRNGEPGKPISLSASEYDRIAIEVRKRLAGSLRVRVEPVSGSREKVR